MRRRHHPDRSALVRSYACSSACADASQGGPPTSQGPSGSNAPRDRLFTSNQPQPALARVRRSSAERQPAAPTEPASRLDRLRGFAQKRCP